MFEFIEASKISQQIFSGEYSAISQLKEHKKHFVAKKFDFIEASRIFHNFRIIKFRKKFEKNI